MPVDRPATCTFGDPDLHMLYITTGGGHLYRVRQTGRRGWLLFPAARED
jgi:sugar lactone lactonase YvrE